MARRFIDTALEGSGSYAGKYYFFSGGQYVRYDAATDRVDASFPLGADQWGLTGAFATRLDAAINGQGDYTGKAYFFVADQYVRYDWATNAMDADFPKPLSTWNLPAPFSSGVDAALNGSGTYAGKTWFFKGGQYVRYDWASNAVDADFPKALSEWGLTGDFATGIEAAINGQGTYAGKAYFFRGDQYVRYDYATNAIDSGYPMATTSWTGLIEMLCAGVAKMKALDWIAATAPKVAAYANSVESGTAYSGDVSLMETALMTHFRYDTTIDQTTRLGYLATICANYGKVVAALNNSTNIFRFRDLSEATADRGVDSAGAPYPAYTVYNASISMTSTFAKFGPLCQAAMMAHEPVHYVDDKADGAHDFYEHGPNYATMSPTDAVHNPSSYACFAEHIFYGSDERYGAGRASE